MDQNSADNNVRAAAELQFSKISAENPSQVAFQLIVSAASDQLPIDIRQSCLLHLKRLVPKFWLMGFQSFIGPPIDQELKVMIRTNLLELATSSTSSKIRLGSSYVIVQIAAADFPDEWPDLLTRLYNFSTDFASETAVIGGLAVLNDLFDDLISEDQFWDGGVGALLISHISNILAQSALSVGVKTLALKLYLTVFGTLLNAELMELTERRKLVNHHIVEFAELLGQLLLASVTHLQGSQGVKLADLAFRSTLYRTISAILNSFRKLVGPHLSRSLLELIVLDLSFGADLYGKFVVAGTKFLNLEKIENSDDPERFFVDYLSELLLCLSLVQHGQPILSTINEENFAQFIQNLVVCATIPKEAVEEYSANFNSFVTDATGLSIHATVRDAISELLMDLNDEDCGVLFEKIQKCTIDPQILWQTRELYQFLAESLYSNEDSESVGKNLALSSYLTSLNALFSLAQGQFNHPLAILRVILLMPKFFEKFSETLSVNTFGVNELQNTLAFAASSSELDLFDLIRSSALICTTLWKNVPGFDLSKLPKSSQTNIFGICVALLEDSDEDSLPVLLEAISVAIDIDHQAALIAGEVNVVDLIFKISFKDAANIQLTIDLAECLQNLLTDIGQDQYLQVCQRLIPLLLEIIKNSLESANVEYTPELYLALELLGYIIGASPQIPGQDDSETFPSEVFTFTFPILKELILRTNDDQILQNGGEVFNNLLQKASKFFMEWTDPASNQSGLQILLEVASKFLLPELSDSAAMNCGLIVISLFENFQLYLDQNFFLQLLQATVRRVMIAKEVITIENLIMVFCKLVLNTSPEQLINALTNITLEDQNGQSRNGFALVLPIWFNSFEVTRGFEKIKQNILALGKIFSINDERVANLVVNGDLIPYDGELIITRSMAKKMPEKFTQIPAPLKIIKLLAAELGFQCQQPDPNDYIPENTEEDGEAGDWEDMDDLGVPNFDKLKSYVDSDEEDYEESDQGIKDMLVQFFKECTLKNLGNFQIYYDMLSDEEKKTITESLVF